MKIVFLIVTYEAKGMKVRIKENTVRFRLTRSEVTEFCATGQVIQKTSFNGAIFKYGLATSNEVSELSATLLDNTITLLVPENLTTDWDSNDKVGFQNTFRLDNGEELFLLLEKDFVCLDNTLEDQSDNYPNPKAG